MVSKIDISDIRLEQLDRSSVAWISKFAHTLRQYNGKVIRLRDDRVLKKIVYEAKRTDSAELKDVYMHLKTAMKAHFNNTRNDLDADLHIELKSANDQASMVEP